MLTRLLTIGAAPVTLLLVLTQLTLAEQGLYFIFVNVFALSQLFEAGVGSIVVQHASHEFSDLDIGARGTLSADGGTLERIRSMLGRSIRWYLGAAVLLAALGIALGDILFRHRVGLTGVPVAGLWAVTVLGTALYLPFIPILNTIEGCGRLVEVQRMRLVQAAMVVASAWLLIPSAGGLAAVATSALLQLIVAMAWTSRRYPALLLFGLRAAVGRTVRVENGALARLYTTQTRTALVWLTAHIASQGLTPLVLLYEGSTAAGQVGATLAIMLVPYTLAMAWLYGRFPEYGALAARGEHTELRTTARSSTFDAALVCAALALALVIGLEPFGYVFPTVRSRLLPLLPVVALGIAAVVNVLLQAMAGYLRAYREEPLTWALIAGYSAMFGAAWVSAMNWGATEAVLAYVGAAVTVALPITALVLRYEVARLAGPQRGSATRADVTPHDTE